MEEEPKMIKQATYNWKGELIKEEMVPWTPPPEPVEPPSVWNELADAFRAGVNSL